jgi:hypothetical protein
MESGPANARVLVVAAKTAGSDALSEAVRERAAKGKATFTLLVPNPTHGLHGVVDPQDQSSDEAEEILKAARPALEKAAGGPIEVLIGDSEPLAAIQDAINIQGFDEIILSTLPSRVSKWLHIDLPSKTAGLGLPLTTVTPQD